jgi:hypothetical protein
LDTKPYFSSLSQLKTPKKHYINLNKIKSFITSKPHLIDQRE